MLTAVVITGAVVISALVALVYHSRKKVVRGRPVDAMTDREYVNLITRVYEE